MALIAGVAFGLTVHHPFAAAASRTSRILLQVAVVGLGFSMDLHQVLHAGRSGFLYTLFGIVCTLSAGTALCILLRVERLTGFLISTGTAICGGSAIAAVGPAVEASDEQMSISMGTVFLLNAVGLVAFPPLGHWLHLTQTQFGLWAALAIHDTSSVVGAGARYSAEALIVATTVKLARALWIVPLTLVAAQWHRSHVAVVPVDTEFIASVQIAKSAPAEKRNTSTRSQWPWFILFFLLAAVMRTYLPLGHAFYEAAATIARTGLTVTLLLIGSGITRKGIKNVGVKPLIMGVLLWLIVAGVSLELIRMGWIAI